MNLVPTPRLLKRHPGIYLLPKERPFNSVRAIRTRSAPDHPEGYLLTISKNGIEIMFREIPGLRAAAATLRQLLREHGRKLPCLKIRDWPDFPRRGVMLDISRGRVPKLETLIDLADKLADYKINELQLYTEHTFAYKKHRSVWQRWGALTAPEIRALDARCKELGIDLVPNQNSFGHLRHFLAEPRLKKLREIPFPIPSENREFLRRPATLAPNHPGTLPFLRGLYNELLPNFSSRLFNIGGDETWDLGKGRSKNLCQRKGKGRVYLDFIKELHREVTRRGRRMMFWGDIILKQPALIRELPKDIIALNWGYEAGHPFNREAAIFAKAGISFYVCPGTSTWQTLIGRHDNAFANLRAAARAGKKQGAIGYLNTDWGDGGHPQPLAVSWPLFLFGASCAWNVSNAEEKPLAKVLSRDIYEDCSGNTARAALNLGRSHLKLGIHAVNETPLGTVIAAPKPEDQELFCRNGLKWSEKIPAGRIRATLADIRRQKNFLAKSTPASAKGKILRRELLIAARMAEESCHFMLWQQAVKNGETKEAAQMARRGMRELEKLETDFARLWPMRNKATPRNSVPFLRWRTEDYRKGRN